MALIEGSAVLHSGKKTWKIGDVVRLKSGGPTMVIRVVEGVLLTCDWFEGTETKQATFDQDMIVGATISPPTGGVPLSPKSLIQRN